MKGKIIILISIIIIITIISYSFSEVSTNEKQISSKFDNNQINALYDKIEKDRIENENSENPYKPKPKEWISSGPFLIDRSEYVLGEKVFVNIDRMDKNTKGQMIFSKIINSTHSYEYKKINFDGSKAQNNFYLTMSLSKNKGICTADMLIGEWVVKFVGTNFDNLEFKVNNQIIPGLEKSYQPVC